MPEGDWKGALKATVEAWTTGGLLVREGAYRALLPHIDAAFHRGLMAGRSQFGYRVQSNRPPYGLTDRQAEVGRLAAAGLTDQEIADRIRLSLDTVKAHMREALARSGARNRAHLSVLLTLRGYVTSEHVPSPRKEKPCRTATAGAAGSTPASRTGAAGESPEGSAP